MPVILQSIIKRVDLQSNPTVFYVFGDNLARTGLGGQAAEMRGEPNAIGFPTKHRPAMGPNDFFTDDDLERVREETMPTYRRLREHLANGGIIIWPADGIGTGMAQLQQRAPKIKKYYDLMLVSLYGTQTATKDK